jgi:hypothetical protein
VHPLASWHTTGYDQHPATMSGQERPVGLARMRHAIRPAEGHFRMQSTLA